MRPGSKLEVMVEEGRVVLVPVRRIRARDLLGIAGLGGRGCRGGWECSR